MAFQPIKVARVLAAAAHPRIDPTDALDDILLHNAKAHADSPPGAILNMSDGLVLRINELLGTDAPDPDAALQKRLHPGRTAAPSQAKSPTAPTRKRPVPETPTPSVSETTTDEPVSEETTSDESTTTDASSEADQDLDPLA